jgi:5'-methylthioadenosine phosphorylase
MGPMPGMFVLADQFIDRTFAREKTFFGTGCVAHVSLARVAPVCSFAIWDFLR